jgi:hypothetical protein
MREQTRRNITYLAGVEALKSLKEQLNWNDHQYRTALDELIRHIRPTLAEV